MCKRVHVKGRCSQALDLAEAGVGLIQVVKLRLEGTIPIVSMGVRHQGWPHKGASCTYCSEDWFAEAVGAPFACRRSRVVGSLWDISPMSVEVWSYGVGMCRLQHEGGGAEELIEGRRVWPLHAANFVADQRYDDLTSNYAYVIMKSSNNTAGGWHPQGFGAFRSPRSAI